MESLINTALGGYDLVEELGKGGMATVYKARQPSLERWVAVKVLDPAYISDESDVLIRFQREAKALAQSRHENILTVYESGGDKGLVYIVMEYVEGGTLKDRLMGEPFDWQRAVRLSLGVGRALAFAHERGIIHRDVKPANILLLREDWPLLADFGLARLQQAKRALTQAGMILGTPDYTSPEQALGDPTDHRADVYALGVVLFEMVTGRLPFIAEKPFDVLLMHINESPPQPRSLVPDIPEQVEEVILTAMAKAPDERYPHMQDMIDHLETAWDTLHVTPRRAQRIDETLHYDTMQIDSIQSILKGPRFVVAATGSVLHIPQKNELVIGRADRRTNTQPDIDLSPYGGGTVGVSRQHARLLREGDNWLIEDLDSTNGTFVNDELVSSSTPSPLRNGDKVRFGNLVLTFHTDETDPV